MAGLNGWIWGVSLIMRITLIQRFLRSSEFVALLLLIAWLIAYNLISLVIYHQFEWREIYPADDFYILNSRDTSFVNSLADTDTRSHRQCDCKIGNGKGCDCTLPVILVMPDMKFALGVPTLLYNNQSFSCDLAKDSSS